MIVRVDVATETNGLADALGRPVSFSYGQVVQRCVVCNTDLALSCDAQVERAWLLRELFAIYDDHACEREVSIAFASEAGLDELYERIEAASVKLAECALGTNRDADVRVRAEHESATLAAWAGTLKRLVRSPVR